MKRLALAVLVLLAGAGAGHAQSLEDRLRGQLVSVTEQLRELQAKQAAQADLEQENAQLKKRLATADAEIHALRRNRSKVEQVEATGPLTAQIAGLTQAKAEGEATLRAAREENTRLNGEAGRLQDENQKTKAALAEADQNLERCEVKNVQAIQIAKAVLTAYQRVSIADVLARKEPLTGLMRPRIEKLEQDYADRIQDSRLDLTAKPPAPANPAPPPSQRP